MNAYARGPFPNRDQADEDGGTYAVTQIEHDLIDAFGQSGRDFEVYVVDVGPTSSSSGFYGIEVNFWSSEPSRVLKDALTAFQSKIYDGDTFTFDFVDTNA